MHSIPRWTAHPNRERRRDLAGRTEIRADFGRGTIVIYQAYPPAIADAALNAAGRFVPPFWFHRMTWIKPSFLWLMHRSNWGQKSGQERVLAVRVKREPDGKRRCPWPYLTSFRPLLSVHPWNGTRIPAGPGSPSMGPRVPRCAGRPCPYFSIQVGLSRHVIREYAEEWVVGIKCTARVREVPNLLQAGQADKAKRRLPPRVYPVSAGLARRLSIDGEGGTR